LKKGKKKKKKNTHRRENQNKSCEYKNTSESREEEREQGGEKVFEIILQGLLSLLALYSVAYFFLNKQNKVAGVRFLFSVILFISFSTFEVNLNKTHTSSSSIINVTLTITTFELYTTLRSILLFFLFGNQLGSSFLYLRLLYSLFIQ